MINWDYVCCLYTSGQRHKWLGGQMIKFSILVWILHLFSLFDPGLGDMFSIPHDLCSWLWLHTAQGCNQRLKYVQLPWYPNLWPWDQGWWLGSALSLMIYKQIKFRCECGLLHSLESIILFDRRVFWWMNKIMSWIHTIMAANWKRQGVAASSFFFVPCGTIFRCQRRRLTRSIFLSVKWNFIEKSGAYSQPSPIRVSCSLL